jgi:hypothetical protein
MARKSDERRIAAPERIVEGHARVAGDGDQIAPARGRDVATRGDGKRRRRLIGGRNEEPVLRNHADEMLIRRTKEIARQGGERLRPCKPCAAREGDHPSQCVDGVQRAVGPECGLRDAGRDRIYPAAAEVECEQLAFGGRDEEEFRLRIEPHDPFDRRQLAPEDPLDGGEPGQTIQLWGATLGGQSDRHAGDARQDLELANPFW